MRIKNAMIGLTIGVLCIVSGCASIVGGGSKQTLNVDSNPKGANIFLGHVVKGAVVDLVDTGKVTPTMIDIPRSDGAIVLKKTGYKDAGVTLTKTINGWFFGNIILGGLLGSSIDSSTGAMNKYDKDAYFVEMQTN